MDFDDYYLGKIPLPSGGVDNASFVALGNKMTDVCMTLRQLEKLTDEKAALEEKKKKIEAEIDDLVYKTYGLTDAEKRIVEDSL
jgi:hypothetical protein